MRSHAYLNTVREIVNIYDGSMPLASWLKQFFRANKKIGSTDRKLISHASYCYYRLGRAFENVSTDERILTAIFLCSTTENIFLKEQKPEWNQVVHHSLVDKIQMTSAENEIDKIFPYGNELSDEIDSKTFSLSFLVQPDLYLRIRPGRKEKVCGQLKEQGLNFKLIDEDCIQLANQSKIDEVLHVDADVVVQDYNSQQVLNSLKENLQMSQGVQAWDCCAASGGKSILWHDNYPSTRLTVSDIRESILVNLRKRFERAGIRSYESIVADVSSEKFSADKKFDVAICDAPCTGSGTWSRTSEQCYFFKKEKIGRYSDLQKKIALNASRSVKENGYFLYITCSVFKKENEEVVDHLKAHASLQLVSMEYLKGYDKKADTLFVALFTR